MNKKMHKSYGLDKIDAHIPNRDTFMHDQWQIAKWRIKAHMTTANGYVGNSNSFQFGTEKKLWRASSEGFLVDAYDAGKSSS